MFRTLRVAPWDGVKEDEQEKTKLISKSQAKKEERKIAKLKKSKKASAAAAAAEERKPAKGQVYLVTNAWMREAWPYD